MNLPKNELINYLSEVIALEAECYTLNAAMECLRSNRIPLADVPDAALQPPLPPKRPPDPPAPIRKRQDGSFYKELKATFAGLPDNWAVFYGAAWLTVSLIIVFGFDTTIGGDLDSIVLFCLGFVLAGFCLAVIGALIYTSHGNGVKLRHDEEQYRQACREHNRKLKQNQEDYSLQCLAAMRSYETKKQAAINARNERVVQNQIAWRINGEIEQAIGRLKDNRDALTGILNQIYGMDVIYPKYRNLVATSSIHEYLESGRCGELEGASGAYNIYEAESRTDHIIRKLDTAIAKLDDIAAVQHKLYKELVRVNENIEDLQNVVHFGIESMKSELKAQAWQINGLSHELESLGGDVGKNFLRIDEYLSKLSSVSDRALSYIETHGRKISAS